MQKVTKYRIAFTLILAGIDLLVISGGLFFLYQIKIHGAGIVSSLKPSLAWSMAALKNQKTRQLWLWLQPAVLGALVWIWTVGRHSLEQLNNVEGVPNPSGHGQFGTARWMQEKEADKIFTVNKF